MQVEPLLLIYLLCGFFTIATVEWYDVQVRFKQVADEPQDIPLLVYIMLHVMTLCMWPVILIGCTIEYRKAISKVKKPKTELQVLSDKISRVEENLQYYRNRENANQQQLFDMTQAIRDLQDTKQAERFAEVLIKEKSKKKGKK